MVRPARPTRRRAPGGSFICPKTSAVLSMTPDSFISRQRSLPSRVRSPTPAKTERPPCSAAMLRISSWMSTVLPTPAPPKSPTLPPLTYGREQVDHLDAGLEDLNRRLELLEGRRRPMDRPALATPRRLALVDGSPEDVEDPAERRLADGDGDRRARVLDVGAAGNAVGGVHRHGADAVVPEMLLHLGDQVDRGAAVLLGDMDAQGVVDARELAVEDGVDDNALDLHDLADVLRLGGHESPG